jgi:zona occludens toxin (predicted ATPase)
MLLLKIKNYFDIYIYIYFPKKQCNNQDTSLAGTVWREKVFLFLFFIFYFLFILLFAAIK